MSEKIYGQFDLETIEKLAEIVERRELSEITLSDGDRTITVKGKRCPPPAPMTPPMQMMPPAPMASGAGPVGPMAPGGPAGTPAGQPLGQSGKEVKAPIVGTFYAAPSPDSKPFVSVGDRVNKGDTIYIIESMKVMSEVQSEFDGVVREITAKNGDPVEYGQTVMILE